MSANGSVMDENTCVVEARELYKKTVRGLRNVSTGSAARTATMRDHRNASAFSVVRPLVRDMEDSAEVDMSITQCSLSGSSATRERLAAEATVRRLEVQLSCNTVAAKRARLDSERQLAELDVELQEARADCEQLRLRDKRRQMEEELLRVEVAELRSQIRDATRMNVSVVSATPHGDSVLDMQALETRAREAEKRVHALELEAAQHREALCVAESELEMQRRVTSAQQAQIVELGVLPRENADLRQRLAHLERSDAAAAPQEDLVIVVRRLRAQLDDALHHEAEAARLKEENKRLLLEDENILVLREENRSLRRRMMRLSELEARVTELQAELELEREKNSGSEWHSLCMQLGSVAPSAMAAQLAHEQRQCVLLADSEASLRARCHSVQAELVQCAQRIDQLQLDAKQSTVALEARDSEVRRLGLRLRLVSQERDGLRDVLHSYQQTESLGPDAEKHLLELEAALHEYRTQLDAADRSLAQHVPPCRCDAEHAAQREAKSSSPLTSQADDAVVLQLRSRIAQLEAELEDLRESNIDWIDSACTKVVHLRNNPSEEARAELRTQLVALRQECERLRQRCNFLETASERRRDKDVEVGGVDEQLTELVEAAVAKRPDPLSEIEELREKVRRCEQRHARTIEVFEKLSGRVQLACRRLLGYGVMLTSNPRQVRLRPATARESEDTAYFLFDMSESGEVALLQNDFSRRHQEDIDHYVLRYGSFPAFTAHLTLQTFGEETSTL